MTALHELPANREQMHRTFPSHYRESRVVDVYREPTSGGYLSRVTSSELVKLNP